jgi:S-DNA-T family DNA segregation ATPase FtsK/SpoIIIE
MDNQTFYNRTANSIAHYLAQELEIVPGVHWVIRNANSGPRVLTLAISINPKYASKIAAMGEALSMAAMLDKGQSIRVGRGNRGTLAIEVPKPESLWFNIGVNSLPRRRGLTATVGLDTDHKPALVDFSSPMSPHVLTAGTTGAGKSNALKLLAYDLASQNEPGDVEFILIDTRKRGKHWKSFAGISHLGHPIITDENEALRALSWACAEIDRRSENGKLKPHVFVGIDELQFLLDKNTSSVADEVGALLKDLTAVGREYNVHCLLGIQNPTASMMGGKADLKRNVVTRLVGKVDTATAAVAATGLPGSGCEYLTGMGDFIQVPELKRLAAALLTEKDVAGLSRSESIRTLDLNGYEDVNHVLAQADNDSKVGRPEDPLEAPHVALALSDESTSQRELNRQFSIGFEKAKRVLEFAAELRAELRALGCRVVCGETLETGCKLLE